MSDIDSINIRRLDGGLLLVFRGLLRRGRTTAVADELGLSQSAVSHALARLRDIFDDPLFTRRPHGLEPTRRARELGPRIDALIDQIDQTLQSGASFDPARTERQFLFSAPEFINALIGAKLVSAFRKLAPRASFATDFMSTADSLRALQRGEIDIALGRFGTLPQGFEHEMIYEDRYCVAARRGHPQLKGRMTYKQYTSIGHVFAHSETETGSDSESDTSDIKLTATVPGWLTVLMLVATSDAIATCPRKLAQRQSSLLGLQVINPPFEPFRIEVKAVRRAGHADAGVDWLLDRIRDAVRN